MNTRKRKNFFFFNDTATTEIYTLSLHDALPILGHPRLGDAQLPGDLGHRPFLEEVALDHGPQPFRQRSEEHTSELQSRQYLVCRLLLEKKKQSYRSLSCSSHQLHSIH